MLCAQIKRDIKITVIYKNCLMCNKKARKILIVFECFLFASRNDKNDFYSIF